MTASAQEILQTLSAAPAGHTEALANLRRLVDLRPDDATAWSALLHVLNLSSDDPEEILREHRRFEEIAVKPRIKPVEKFWAGRNPIRVVKIGYVSPYFLDHPQSRFLVPLFSNHNRDVFHITCYSDSNKQDEITRRFASVAHVWRNMAGKTDDQFVRQIFEDGIDILVNLAVHSPGGRPLVCAHNPAPLQLAWLPYPATTGLSVIGYRITDVHIDPLGTRDKIYSECSVRLPHTFWAYDPLDNETTVQPLPAAQRGQITFGCLSDLSKITEKTLDLWRQVLNQIPTSRLIVRAPSKASEARLTEMLNFGDRLQFVPDQSRPDDLKTHYRIDIALDTFPFNGAAESFDAFWMGVPVLTLAGNTGVSRTGMSLAANLGLADQLVANTAEQFVERATKISADLPALAQLRSGARQMLQRSPLMDGYRFARHMESAYLKMWQIWCRSA